MTSSHEQVRAVIARQAGEWFAAMEEGPLDEGERIALTAWLRASPMHVKEFLGVAVIARDLPAAADDPDVPMESLLQQARTDDADGIVVLDQAQRSCETPLKRLGMSRAWAFVAAAAVVTLVAALVWRVHDGELLGLSRTYETARGEQTAWRLPDGSMLHLNTDSVATVRYSRAERVVEVHRGQAYFEVGRDGQRRFRVAAGEAQVLAVGTAFDVYRKQHSTLVTVAEGVVAVFVGAAPQSAQPTTAAQSGLRVEPGRQLGIDAGKMWDQPRPVDLGETEAWLHRKITFQGRPLGEVVEEFNRYSRVPVEIDDPTLRALRVSGSFDTNDRETFLGFLESLDGVALQKTATSVRVIRVSPPPGAAPPSAH
jgi:transmembrane sensor